MGPLVLLAIPAAVVALAMLKKQSQAEKERQMLADAHRRAGQAAEKARRKATVR